MGDIIKEILKHLPADKISDAGFEGANIVLYTKDRKFFLDNKGEIKKIVDDIKKRVELRPDPAITESQERTEKIIKKVVPEKAGVSSIIFDPQRSQVVIETYLTVYSNKRSSGKNIVFLKPGEIVDKG